MSSNSKSKEESTADSHVFRNLNQVGDSNQSGDSAAAGREVSGSSLRRNEADADLDRDAADIDAGGLSLELDVALHDAQEILKAAERVVKESCGEKWLLQPFIPDMERNEYR